MVLCILSNDGSIFEEKLKNWDTLKNKLRSPERLSWKYFFTYRRWRTFLALNKTRNVLFHILQRNLPLTKDLIVKLFHREVCSQFSLGQLPQFDEHLLTNHVAHDNRWSVLEPRDVLWGEFASVPSVLFVKILSFFTRHSEVVDTSVENRP